MVYPLVNYYDGVIMYRKSSTLLAVEKAEAFSTAKK